MRSYSDTTVIIPTINEEDSIGVLIGSITLGYPGIRIIVADDGSTDSTRAIVGRISRRNGNVVFMDRSNEEVHGLTVSVISAARRVTTAKSIVMDGDLQHPPAKIGPMAAALDRSDIAVGVRTKVRGWGAHRMLMSRSITALSLLVFKAKGKQTTSDMMSGFFGIRTGLLRGLAAKRNDEFVHEGYKVLLDILRMVDKDTKIVEVNYSTFHKRKSGRSKLLPKHIVTTLVSTLK